MTAELLLWMRHEDRATERRAPIVPEDAADLVRQGLRVVVEDSPQRSFPADEYAAVGCRVVAAGSWVDAPPAAYVIGIKELPERPSALRHRHIYFGHAYKGQAGARELLGRFAAGGGALLDLEYLVDERGRRLAAFGYWAGYAGAALAVLHARRRLEVPLAPTSRPELDAALGTSHGELTAARALVIGALGRSGRGAADALTVAGMPVTGWDQAETAHLDRHELLAHDLLVNAVLATDPVPPFVRPEDVSEPTRALSLICDVTCDVASECNVLPIYDQVTTWAAPVRRLHVEPPLDLIAIDNLPSLLPAEASRSFSAELAPLLPRLANGDGPWARGLAAFHAAARDTTGMPAPDAG